VAFHHDINTFIAVDSDNSYRQYRVNKGELMLRQQNRYRNILLSSILFCASTAPAWAASTGQSIPEAAHQNWWRGISLVIHGQVEGVSNLSGGISTGSTATGLWK
jgi:porin